MAKCLKRSKMLPEAESIGCDQPFGSAAVAVRQFMHLICYQRPDARKAVRLTEVGFLEVAEGFQGIQGFHDLRIRAHSLSRAEKMSIANSKKAV